MNVVKVKNLSKWLFKLGLSSLALYFVFKKVDPNLIIETAFTANPYFLALAFFAFNLSKIISSIRLNEFYRAIKVNLTEKYNLSLYYLSMFYNLFLPGSIGGDAYKVYLLNQEGKGSLKMLFMATLLDRLNGLAILVFLSFFLILINLELHSLSYIIPISIAGILLTIPAFFLMTKLFFNSFIQKFRVTVHLSFWVQSGQLACAYFILLAIGVSNNYLDYLVLFMVSSVFAVIPISIGGVGARELVFLFSPQFMAIDESKAVSFTLLFFSVLALSSLVGLVFIFLPYREKTQNSESELSQINEQLG